MTRIHYSLAIATGVAEEIARVAQTTRNCSLERLFLYGSTVNNGSGHDIDLILEVSLDKFKDYAGYCGVVLNGIRPFSDDLLDQNYPFPGPEWEYFSPKEPRSKSALATICVDIRTLKIEVPREALDVVCLPKGWDDEKSSIFHDLGLLLRNSKDPHFLFNAKRSSRQIFPSA